MNKPILGGALTEASTQPMHQKPAKRQTPLQRKKKVRLAVTGSDDEGQVVEAHLSRRQGAGGAAETTNSDDDLATLAKILQPPPNVCGHQGQK